LNFLIRVDASNEIGIGHFMRCIALGQMLKDENQNVSFLTKTNNKSLLDRLKKENFKTKKLPDITDILIDAERTLKYARQIDANWIVTDGYIFKTEYQRKIKNSGIKLMCIDDIAECHYISDIVLNQNLNAEKIYKYSSEPYTKLLLGIKYVLLRREFRNFNNFTREIKKECKNILISMGGSDVKGLSSQLLKYLERISDLQFNIKVIVGPESIITNEIISLSKKSKHSIEILTNVEDLSEYIKWCDISISTSGSIVWELLVFKTPMVLITVAENQENIACELEKEGLSLNLAYIDKPRSENIEDKIQILFRSAELRKIMSERSKNNQIASENVINYLN
jgi:UDP-2,4-diacetamido-2,4,6-trideoxy-beta-L-altropyranose hydrolase